MLDPDAARRNLFRAARLGVRLSIDDFGTGYSSLSHLQRLPLHEIKIDKSFVIQMTDNDNDLVIVRSTIDLAHNLGLSVVAEGIETGEHLAMLQDLGCDLGQGFFVSQPLPIDRLTSWFDQTPWQLRAAAPARRQRLVDPRHLRPDARLDRFMPGSSLSARPAGRRLGWLEPEAAMGTTVMPAARRQRLVSRRRHAPAQRRWRRQRSTTSATKVSSWLSCCQALEKRGRAAVRLRSAGSRSKRTRQRQGHALARDDRLGVAERGQEIEQPLGAVGGQPRTISWSRRLVRRKAKVVLHCERMRARAPTAAG